MNIANVLNRKLGLVTVQNLQRVFNFFSTSLGLIDGALPDTRPYKVYTARITTAVVNSAVSDADIAVLENTLGFDPEITIDPTINLYQIYLDAPGGETYGLSEKVIVLTTPLWEDIGGGLSPAWVRSMSTKILSTGLSETVNRIKLRSVLNSGGSQNNAWTTVDDLIVELRVYN